MKKDTLVDKNNLMYEAALAHFQAQEKQALATLEIYFNHAVGIGEHSNLLNEIKQATQELSEAQECLRTLKQLQNP
tara:strand:+ start:436 stop:663 length:228 start_codon:yes stop_codon:yes gene_type:complete